MENSREVAVMMVVFLVFLAGNMYLTVITFLRARQRDKDSEEIRRQERVKSLPLERQMKSKSSPAKKIETLVLDIDFTTALSVEDCRQRLIAANGTRTRDKRWIDVVTTGNHFVVSLVVLEGVGGPKNSSYPRQARAAKCVGDLRAVPGGTRVTAEAEIYENTKQEEQFLIWMWALWVGTMLSLGALTIAETITVNELATFVCMSSWFPPVMHIGIRGDVRRVRNRTPDLAQWLYKLLYEFEGEKE